MRRSTIALYALATAVSPAVAEESAAERLVASISSVAQVKKKLKELMLEECGGGSGCDSIASEICAYVAALDAKVDYQILGTWTHAGEPTPEVPISRRDIQLMKLIFSQCKPSNYQYWLWGDMLHVAYDPSEKIDKAVRAALGARRK